MPSSWAIGSGGDGVVAGDHAHPDAGALGLGDGLLGLGTRRIDLADQRRQLEVLHQGHQVGRGIEGGGIELALGKGEHAQALAGDALVLGQSPSRAFVGEGALWPPGMRPYVDRSRITSGAPFT